MEPDEEFVAAGILREVDEAGIAVFKDIIHQFLNDPEDDEFAFGLEAFAVVMKAGAGIHAARSADLLKKVVHGRFQPRNS